MPHLFIPAKNGWTSVALTGDLFELPAAPQAAPSGAVVRRAAAGTPHAGWHLLAPPALPVRINGEPVSLGIRALRDKDEIRLPGAASIFFSTEELVAVEPFTGSSEGKCPRCAKAIERNAPAARCPCCHIWYHQSDTRPCFLYGDLPTCVACGGETAVNTEFNWVPEEC